MALIYKPASVEPVGDFVILDSTVDPDFIDTRNRPALIQTFEQVGTDERFTVAVNHLKSKGSSCDIDTDDPNLPDDPDLGDGQGNCPGTRTDAAQALADYLATDPTGSGDPDFLIIGDLNSYRRETPITTLVGAGYTDLIEQFVGDDAYSFVFDGQLGYLDHALATDSLKKQVTGATEWKINSDEVPLFDYNDEFADPGEASFERESAALSLYTPTPARSSDHDPLVVGLDLPANRLEIDDALDHGGAPWRRDAPVHRGHRRPVDGVPDPRPAGGGCPGAAGCSDDPGREDVRVRDVDEPRPADLRLRHRRVRRAPRPCPARSRSPTTWCGSRSA